MDYRTFKDLLRNYYKYQIAIEEIKTDLELVLYEMTGVKAIDYSKPYMQPNPSLSHERKLELIDKKAALELELEYTYTAIKLIELKLSKLSESDKQICLKIIAKGETYESVGNEQGYTISGMWRKVRRALKNIL